MAVFKHFITGLNKRRQSYLFWAVVRANALILFLNVTDLWLQWKKGEKKGDSRETESRIHRLIGISATSFPRVFRWQVSAATSREFPAGSVLLVEPNDLRCTAATRLWKCKLLGRRGWPSGKQGDRLKGGRGVDTARSRPTLGLEAPRQYWGSCASGPHTVIHQIRTSSSTSLYRLDSRSIQTCLEILTITRGIWGADLWHIEIFFLKKILLLFLTPLLIFLNQLDNIGTKGEDERGRRIDSRSILW